MKLLASIAIVMGLILPGHGVRARQQEVEWLSVSNLNTAGDRIVAFDLTASDGSIRSLPNIPRGWFLAITNDASGATEVRGNAQVGAASLGAGFFARFVGIQRQSPGTPISNVKLEIVVTRDFASERHIDVPPGDLLLSEPAR
jgi:hypothetical protein